MYSDVDTPKGGFPHSEISGSKLICQLPEAYRRLSRPSSPVIAKASTTCTYSLDPITLTPSQGNGTRFELKYLCANQRRLDNSIGRMQSHLCLAFHASTSIRFQLNNLLHFFQIFKERNQFDQKIKAKQFSARTARPVWLCLLKMKAVVEVDGIEPTTPCLQSRCSPS